jgi:hypothetical protein
MSNPPSGAISLTDRPLAVGLLRAIFRPIETRRNEIRFPADHAGSQIVGLTASWNALPGRYQGTLIYACCISAMAESVRTKPAFREAFGAVGGV